MLKICPEKGLLLVHRPCINLLGELVESPLHPIISDKFPLDPVKTPKKQHYTPSNHQFTASNPMKPPSNPIKSPWNPIKSAFNSIKSPFIKCHEMPMKPPVHPWEIPHLSAWRVAPRHFWAEPLRLGPCGQGPWRGFRHQKICWQLGNCEHLSSQNVYNWIRI